MAIVDSKNCIRRKQTKILDIGPGLDDGNHVTLQIVNDEGEVIIANYKRYLWVKPPSAIAKKLGALLGMVPVAIIRKQRGRSPEQE